MAALSDITCSKNDYRFLQHVKLFSRIWKYYFIIPLILSKLQSYPSFLQIVFCFEGDEKEKQIKISDLSG